MEKTSKERYFSIELNNKTNIKNLALTNNHHENVLIEGNLGELQYASFSEGVILEVVGDKGILRINLLPSEIAAQKEVKSNV
jgi:hypothetical protein